MKINKYPLVFPFISSDVKFVAILLAMLLGSALLAGLAAPPKPVGVATQGTNITSPDGQNG